MEIKAPQVETKIKVRRVMDHFYIHGKKQYNEGVQVGATFGVFFGGVIASLLYLLIVNLWIGL
jgi:hypothetical protein